MPRAISKCPNCGEPVSPFAAGCAICGADLRQARADLAAKRARRPQVGMPRISDDGVRIGVSVLATLFSPMMGAALSGYFAYDADRNGRVGLRNLMVVLLVLSLVGVFAYARLWGGILLGI
jgi:hypothetical protein